MNEEGKREYVQKKIDDYYDHYNNKADKVCALP